MGSVIMPRNRNSKFIFCGDVDENRKNLCRAIIETRDVLRVSTIRYADMDKNEDIFDTALRDLKNDERIVVSRINKLESAARLKARLVLDTDTYSDVVSYSYVYDSIVNESLEKWGLEK